MLFKGGGVPPLYNGTGNTTLEEKEPRLQEANRQPLQKLIREVSSRGIRPGHYCFCKDGPLKSTKLKYAA